MLLLISLIATWYLIGLCWLVQAVVYPQFGRVAVAEFVAYHKAHTTWITPVVLPMMGIELATAVALVVRSPQDRVFQIALLLVVIIWVNTFAMAVPKHNVLRHGHDAVLVRRLVRVNWVRTLAWTIRGLLLLWKAAA